METTYLFTADITNSPLFPNITRKISFLSHPEYEMNARKIVKTELVIRHFDGEEIMDLNKSIVLYTDGEGGARIPIDIDIDIDGNIIGYNSLPLLTDLDWYIHWLQSDKGMLSMFKLIAKQYDVRQYDVRGVDVGPYSPDAKYTLYDLKYFGIIK